MPPVNKRTSRTMIRSQTNNDSRVPLCPSNERQIPRPGRKRTQCVHHLVHKNRRSSCVCPHVYSGRSTAMKELPDDLAALGAAELSEQRAIRDDKLATLFRRWPALDRLELRQLREMYGDRLRIARYFRRVRGARSTRKHVR